MLVEDWYQTLVLWRGIGLGWGLTYRLRAMAVLKEGEKEGMMN